MADPAVIIGDGILAAGAVAAAVLGRRALTTTRDAAQEARDYGAANHAHLEQLRDESVNDRIRAVVAEYANQHPHLVGEAVMFDAMRDLLDAIIAANLGTADDPYPSRPSRRAARLTDDDADRR